jgi:ABC-type transporter Mla subunit MlaD
MNGRTFRIAVLVVVVIIGLLVLLFVTKPFASRLTVKAYFTDASGLRNGAPVRLAGVDVGR